MEPEDLDGKSPRALAQERKHKQRANASAESKGKEKEANRLAKKRCLQTESSADRNTSHCARHTPSHSAYT